MQLLEYERCEFLLVGATENVQGELGASARGLAGAASPEICADADEQCLLEELKNQVNEEKTGVQMGLVEGGEWV